MKLFCFSSKLLQILTFVFSSLIGKTLFGSFCQLGCADGLKNVITGLKATTFSSSHKASVGAGKYLMCQA